jgi:hypothetical protein
MPSKNTPDSIDLAGVPTEAADIAALEVARKLDRLEPLQFLEFLLAFSERHPPDGEIPPYHEPFVL